MTIGVARSIAGVPIRLTDERWEHIVRAHQEINPKDFRKFMNVASNPDLILKGSKGELLAIQKVPRKKLWIVVVYKEVSSHDGFVLTAYFSNALTWLLRKEIVWSKQ